MLQEVETLHSQFNDKSKELNKKADDIINDLIKRLFNKVITDFASSISLSLVDRKTSHDDKNQEYVFQVAIKKHLMHDDQQWVETIKTIIRLGRYSGSLFHGLGKSFGIDEEFYRSTGPTLKQD